VAGAPRISGWVNEGHADRCSPDLYLLRMTASDPVELLGGKVSSCGRRSSLCAIRPAQGGLDPSRGGRGSPRPGTGHEGSAAGPGTARTP